MFHKYGIISDLASNASFVLELTFRLYLMLTIANDTSKWARLGSAVVVSKEGTLSYDFEPRVNTTMMYMQNVMTLNYSVAYNSRFIELRADSNVQQSGIVLLSWISS